MHCFFWQNAQMLMIFSSFCFLVFLSFSKRLLCVSLPRYFMVGDKLWRRRGLELWLNILEYAVWILNVDVRLKINFTDLHRHNGSSQKQWKIYREHTKVLYCIELQLPWEICAFVQYWYLNRQKESKCKCLMNNVVNRFPLCSSLAFSKLSRAAVRVRRLTAQLCKVTMSTNHQDSSPSSAVNGDPRTAAILIIGDEILKVI